MERFGFAQVQCPSKKVRIEPQVFLIAQLELKHFIIVPLYIFFVNLVKGFLYLELRSYKF